MNKYLQNNIHLLNILIKKYKYKNKLVKNTHKR